MRVGLGRLLSGQVVTGKSAEGQDMDEATPDALTESELLRRELGEILDRLIALPSDAFRERAALAGRQVELRAALAKGANSGVGSNQRTLE